ncbi:MAG TPA: PEP-CTERM sorting domain-containing protein, partial [Thermomicrobiales bacterium]|nr:PEP-CTERM sorting domain-containing protein [Thermomicrobiales bacterium]
VAAGGTATDGTYTYSRVDSTFDCSLCPTADAGTAVQGGSGTTINLGSGFTYLLGKYDGPNAGDLIWNVTGLTSVTIPASWGPLTQQYGLSHWSVFNPTPSDGPGDGPGEGPAPEPASLLLFGSALSAFGFRMRRALR